MMIYLYGPETASEIEGREAARRIRMELAGLEPGVRRVAQRELGIPLAPPAMLEQLAARAPRPAGADERSRLGDAFGPLRGPHPLASLWGDPFCAFG